MKEIIPLFNFWNQHIFIKLKWTDSWKSLKELKWDRQKKNEFLNFLHFEEKYINLQLSREKWIDS